MELGEKQGRFSPVNPPRSPAPPKYTPVQTWQNNPILPVISYCGSSILMTVANKYILSFPDYNLNFFLLAVQVSMVRQYMSKRADCSRLLSVSLPFQLASKPASSHTEISRQTKQRNVSIFTAFADGMLIIPRVSNIFAARGHALHQHESSPVSLHPCVHYFQELDDHPHRIRRSPMVWWLSVFDGSALLRPDGHVIRCCSMGRHQACSRVFRH